MNNRPHNRRTTTSQGKVGVGKGERLGGGNRSGGSGGNGNNGCAIAVLLGVFALLPKKARRVVLLILAVAAVLYFGYSCLMDDSDPSDSIWDETADTHDPYAETEPRDTMIGLGTTSVTTAQTPTTSAPSVSDGKSRERYTKLVGNGDDTVTVMVYLCGTDLESEYGMGTSDLSEMLSANLSDKVNVIVQTGGASKWKNNVVSSSKLQRYQLVGGKLKLLDELSSKSMTSPDTLSSFIKFCGEEFPANRNFLILWDHGGGTLSGYGYDEKFGSSGSMTLDKLNDALSDAGQKFDFIGFDACLMATFETAVVANDYADYLVASEELEPGTGWYYTGWLDLISKNTSTPTVDIAKKLIDDYVASNRSTGSKVTLSVIDLAELSVSVPTAFNKFSKATTELISSDDYKVVSNARAATRRFSAKSKINQIDLIDFCERLGTAEAKSLAKALSSCVKYNGTNISGANGVSIYFPYESTRDMNSAVRIYEELGIDPEYTDCIRSFASLGAAGQVANSSYGSDSGLMKRSSASVQSTSDINMSWLPNGIISFTRHSIDSGASSI